MLNISVFLLLISVVFFGAHAMLYFAVVKFFGIASLIIKKYLALIFIFLSFSFFISSLLSHWKDNFLTRGFYLFSSIWLGILVNLLLACLMVLLIHHVNNLFLLKWSIPIIAGIFFGIAFAHSFYGIKNAFSFQVKNIEVAIPNLPENWRNKKVVQISDVHLGHIYKKDFLENIVSSINEIDPEAVFITGDLFDGMDGELASLVEPLEKIKAKKGVFFVTGNHETYLGKEKSMVMIEGVGIKVLNDEIVDLGGIQLIGLSYPGRAIKKDIGNALQSLIGFEAKKPSILLYHAPTGIEEAKNFGINLQLAGHTHRGQIFPFNFITSQIFRGYDYGLKTDGDYSIYTSNGIGTWGPPMRTGNIPEIVSIKLTGK